MFAEEGKARLEEWPAVTRREELQESCRRGGKRVIW
jgi:hypothetical protein